MRFVDVLIRLDGLGAGSGPRRAGRIGGDHGAVGVVDTDEHVAEGAERNKALGIWSGVGGMGATAALLIGGPLADGPGWEWIFFINVPVAAAGLLVNRLHRLLLELIPGGAPRFLSAIQAKVLLAAVRPRDVAGRTRRQLAAELLGEVAVLDRKLKASDVRLREAVTAAGAGLPDLYGIGPAGAARLLGDVGDISRFADRDRFASWNGTAPLDACSGEQHRHQLSRAGNRRINRVLHIMAIVQLRHDTPGRAYYRRRLAEGKTPMEALRCLKRRLSNVVYRQMLADAAKASPGGQAGATTTSSAADQIPSVGTSEQPQPGPTTQPTDPVTTDVPALAAAPRRGRPTPAHNPASTGAVEAPGSRAARKGRRAATRSALEAGGTAPQARRGTTATTGA